MSDENIEIGSGREGFRLGEYFIAFAPGEFIKEDPDGKMYILIDIYKIHGDNKATKLMDGELPPELEETINKQINEYLLAAINKTKLED